MQSRVAIKRPSPRRGFTLLEMLVAIGIILVLVTIAVLAFQALDRSASQRSTRATLQTAQSMIAAYESGGRSVQDEPAVRNGNLPYNVTQWGGGVGDVRAGGTARRNAILYATQVIQPLIKMPKNKEALANLPPKMTSKSDDGLPFLVDAWGNPMILVPAKGLAGIKLAQKADGTFSPGPGQTITSPDYRPFWASAGPDGVFSYGDDNLYSFEK